MNRRRFLKTASGLFVAAAPALIVPKAQAQLAGGLMFPGPGTPASGGGGFTPSSLSNLQVWCKGDVGTFQDTGGTTPSTNGTSVKRWNDQSGNGNNLLVDPTSAVANLVTGSLNGLPTVNPFGVGAAQPLRVSLPISNSAVFSYFGVFTDTNAGTRNFDRFVSGIGNGASADFNNLNGFQLATDNTSTTPIPISGGQNSLNVNTTITGWKQIGMIYNGTTGTLYVSGSSVGTITVATNLVTPLLFAMGAVANLGSPLTGGCAELIAGNSDWTSSVSNIHTYLFGRWGV